MRTGSGQTGSQAGGSTMVTPSALVDSGATTRDRRKAKTTRGRFGIRCMAVSSPGQATLAAACVGDAARVFRVPVRSGGVRWSCRQLLFRHQLLQRDERAIDLIDDGL